MDFLHQLRDRRRHQPTSAATPRSVDLLSCMGEVEQEVTIALDELAGLRQRIFRRTCSGQLELSGEVWFSRASPPREDYRVARR